MYLITTKKKKTNNKQMARALRICPPNPGHLRLGIHMWTRQPLQRYVLQAFRRRERERKRKREREREREREIERERERERERTRHTDRRMHTHRHILKKDKCKAHITHLLHTRVRTWSRFLPTPAHLFTAIHRGRSNTSLAKVWQVWSIEV